jgi:ribosomal protein S6--L-glutamate ligase
MKSETIKTRKTEKKIAGWREWVSLPSLEISHIKAKMDTGARTSSLHAFDLQPFKKNGDPWVKFKVYPFQRNKKIVRQCVAQVIDHRWVKSSNGHREKRYVINTDIKIGDEQWSIELTLTNRDEMGFRMLLGRTAMKKKVIVDASRSYCIGKRVKKKKKKH